MRRDATGGGRRIWEVFHDTLAVMLSGIGFFAAFVGTQRRFAQITTEIQQLVTSKPWALTE